MTRVRDFVEIAKRLLTAQIDFTGAAWFDPNTNIKSGRPGVQISALGVGGHHFGDFPTVNEAIRLLHEAIDGGITFFDNCLGIFQRQDREYPGSGIEGPPRQRFVND